MTTDRNIFYSHKLCYGKNPVYLGKQIMAKEKFQMGISVALPSFNNREKMQVRFCIRMVGLFIHFISTLKQDKLQTCSDRHGCIYSKNVFVKCSRMLSYIGGLINTLKLSRFGQVCFNQMV